MTAWEAFLHSRMALLAVGLLILLAFGPPLLSFGIWLGDKIWGYRPRRGRR